MLPLMSRLREWAVRLAGSFRRGRSDEDIRAELQSHLEMAEDAAHRAGDSGPAAARASAVRHGGVIQAIDAQRDQRGFRWLADLTRDGRYAWRGLLHDRGFSVAVTLLIALGVGANVAIFSVADDFLFGALPVKDPERLVQLSWRPGQDGGTPRVVLDPTSGLDEFSNSSEQSSQAFSLRTFERFGLDQTLLADVLAFGMVNPGIATIDGQAQNIGLGLFVSGNYYNALGVPAVVGRTITTGDDGANAPPVAVISHRLWQRVFAGDPAAVGKIVTLGGARFGSGVPITIVGVTPASFDGVMLGVSAEITLPLALAPMVHQGGAATRNPDYWWLQIMGRLKPGTTIDEARAGLEGLFQATAREGLANPNDRPRLALTIGAPRYTGQERASNIRAMLLPMGMVGLILASVCANVANLLLVRGAARRGEIATRLALGASRARLVRQLLTESLLLTVGGALLGLLLSRWLLYLFATMFTSPEDRDVFIHLTMNSRVVAYSLAMGLLTGIVVGVVPAIRLTRVRPDVDLQRSARHPARRSRLSQTLIVTQIAISFVLLTGAGLFVRTVGNLQSVDVGFDRERLATFYVDPLSAYPRNQFAAYYGRLIEHVQALPGIRSVTFATMPPWNWGPRAKISVGGETAAPRQSGDVLVNQTGPNYFDVLGTPVVIGRGFGPGDGPTAPKVAIVNEAFARTYFGTESPVGRHFRIDEVPNLNSDAADAISGEREIVGVVRDLKQQGLREPETPVVNIPYAQGGPDRAVMVVRTMDDPAGMIAALLGAVSAADPNVPRPTVRTGAEYMARLVEDERTFANLFGLLGLIALALASIGLYGLVSYTVLRRTHEIGLRMALGAQPGGVVRAVLRDTLGLVGAGVVVGFAGAAAATQLIVAMLYGLSGTDPFTYGAVALTLTVVALAASLVPARRAALVDPVLALRME